MTATNHGLMGAAIAVSMQSYPAAAIILSFLSHFLLDAFPHYTDKSISTGSQKFVRFLLFDCTLAVIVTLSIALVFSEIWWFVVLCSFLAASPDLMWIYYEYINPKLREKHLLPRFHSRIQWSTTKQGWIVEALWFVILFPTLIFIGVS